MAIGLLRLSIFDTIEYNTRMKVVFLEDVTNIGKMGEVKEIADGYGRNYLLPRKLALLATPSALKKADVQVKKEQERRRCLADEMEKQAQQIEGFSLTFTEKVASEDNLYGSVRDGDIANQLN
ncbi:50S ribosomal protein L9, partial [Chloroflexota bacterium]